MKKAFHVVAADRTTGLALLETIQNPDDSHTVNVVAIGSTEEEVIKKGFGHLFTSPYADHTLDELAAAVVGIVGDKGLTDVQKIPAIKMIRSLSKAGLKESKDALEDAIADRKRSLPQEKSFG